MSERNPARFNTSPNAQNRSAEEQRRLMDEFEAEEAARYEANFNEDNYNDAMAARERDATARENDANAAIEGRIMENVRAKQMYMIAQHIAELRTKGGEPEIIADKEKKLQELLGDYSTAAQADRDAALRAAEMERDTPKGYKIRADKEAEAEAEMVKRMEEADFILHSTDPAWVSEKLESKSTDTEPASTHNEVDDLLKKEPKKAKLVDDDPYEYPPFMYDDDAENTVEYPDVEYSRAPLDRVDNDDFSTPRYEDARAYENPDGTIDESKIPDEIKKEEKAKLDAEAAAERGRIKSFYYEAQGRMHDLFNRGKDKAMEKGGKKTKIALGVLAFAAAATATWALVKNGTGPGHVDPSAIDAGGIPLGPETPVTPDVDVDTTFGPDVLADSDHSSNDGPEREREVPLDNDSTPEDNDVSPEAGEVEEGEGWIQTMNEAGMADEDKQQAVLANDEVMQQLADMGLAYRAEDLGGWGIKMPEDGEMPQEALDILRDAYDNL